LNNFVQNFLSNRVLSRFSILAIDLFMIVFSCLLMYFVKYGFGGLTQEVRTDGSTLCLLLIFSIRFHLLPFVHSGVSCDFPLFPICCGSFIALGFGYALTYLAVTALKRIYPEFHLTNDTFVAIFLLNIFLMSFSRILVKEVYEAISGNGVKQVNVFIYGTKQAGISVAKALKGNNEFNYRVLGFISDEKHMIGKELLGVCIYAHDENLFRILETKDVKTIIVSPQKMEEIKIPIFLANFVDHNISLLTTVPVMNGMEPS